MSQEQLLTFLGFLQLFYKVYYQLLLRYSYLPSINHIHSSHISPNTYRYNILLFHFRLFLQPPIYVVVKHFCNAIA